MHLKSYDSEVNIMKVTAVVSTKAGPGKTTVGVNLGAFCADAGIRTLLIDLDNQPSLSSFYALSHEAPGGTYQLIANNETRADQVISHTCIPNLSLIHSNGPFNQLTPPLTSGDAPARSLRTIAPAPALPSRLRTPHESVPGRRGSRLPAAVSGHRAADPRSR